MTKILLVEDNEDNRDMLSRRLLRKGYEVVIAVDGQQGVDKAHAERPHLILMDMSLPILDGWEATRRIRDSEAICTVPIIALTAHAMAGDREKALEAGCDDYDTKPIELPVLLRKIEALLSRPAGGEGHEAKQAETSGSVDRAIENKIEDNIDNTSENKSEHKSEHKMEGKTESEWKTTAGDVA